jgi:type I restriction enzyme R subunit
METEADTCRTLITPKLQTAGWEQEAHAIAEQGTIPTDASWRASAS